MKPRRLPVLTLRTTIALLVLAVISLVLLATHVLYVTQITYEAKKGLQEQVKATAHALALSPEVIDALEKNEPAPSLQTYAEKVRVANELLFAVVMDMEGIRLSHPDTSRIGQHFQGGDELLALQGQETVSEAAGTLGRSLRYFTPVYSGDRQVGAVAVGISMDQVKKQAAAGRKITYWALVLGATVGGLGAFVLAKQIKRIMFGMEPGEIAALLEQRSAMLHSLKEGVLAIDRAGRITLINDEARRLFRQSGIQDDPLAQLAGRYWPALSLDKVMESQQPLYDEELDFHGSTLLVNAVPIAVGRKIAGAVATFRDKTEISRLLHRLSGVSHYAAALRVQNHEFMNHLHVIMGMTHMGRYEKLEAYIMGTVDRYHQEIGTLIRQIRDPVIAGFVLGKMSRARELGLRFQLSADSFVPEAATEEDTHLAVTVLGNLLENAFDAVSGTNLPEVGLSLDYSSEQMQLKGCVQDNGPGIPERDAPFIFHKGYSTKGENRGFGLYLAKQSLDKAGGTIGWQHRRNTGTIFSVTIPYRGKEEVKP